MKKLSFIMFALVFSLFPLTVFAGEGPLQMPSGANTSAVMHNNAGIDEWRKENYESALEHFGEASKIEPTGETHFNEAISLDKLGRHREAAMHFKAAKKHANGNAMILNSRILKKHL